MEKIETRIKLHIQLGVFAVIWIVLLLTSGITSLSDLIKVAEKFPQAVTVYAFMGFIFTKWAWRWKIFRGWVVKIPDLQGTWHGTLTSTWVDPSTNQKLRPIEIQFVVKQSFDKLDCHLYTKESASYSTAADINRDQGGALYLNYNYTNRPRALLRERSEIHDGAAVLKITRTPYSLEGEYWTSRKTTGEIKLKFYSKKLSEKFIGQ